MDFAGNNFTYLSKQKVQKLKVKPKKQNDQMDVVFEEKSNVKRGRSQDRNRSRSRSRSRSGSVKSINNISIDENYSCSDEDEEELADDVDIKVFKPKKQKRKLSIAKMVGQENKKFHHEIDTNVLSINFAFLGDKVAYATGDPTYCNCCKSVLNNMSLLKPISDNIEDGTLWECEFCNYSNKILIETEEIPKSDIIDYFVMSKSQVDKTHKDINFNDEKSILFCFDISGSMCVTAPVKGKHKFKGATLDKDIAELMKFSDGSDQFYEQGGKGLTYISRLQCLQAAIESNLSLLKESSPNTKVGFVTFNNEVLGIGDGTQDPIKINGNNLSDAEHIRMSGEKNCHILSKPIKDTHDFLLKHLYTIQENGQTALGPAILFSLNLLAGAANGSKIILCTDGMANIGIYALESITDKDQLEQIESFYRELGLQAKERGIVISLITFQGEESKIEVLTALIEATGGEIIRVRPHEILDQFSNLLTNEVIATNVKLNIKLHKIMSFRNERQEDLTDGDSTLVKDIGNVTSDTELYVEYHFKKNDLIREMKDIDIEQLKEVTFQAIINYTSKTGERCIRVITRKQMVTSEKEEINKQAKFDILSVNAIQQSSKLAKHGQYREAQAQALAWKGLIKENLNSNNTGQEAYYMFNKNMNQLNNQLQVAQYDEIVGSSIPQDSFSNLLDMNVNMNMNNQMMNQNVGGMGMNFGASSYYKAEKSEAVSHARKMNRHGHDDMSNNIHNLQNVTKKKANKKK